MTAPADLEAVKAMLWGAFRKNGPDIRENSQSPPELVTDATHRPTGLVATAQEQRLQHANRKLARLKLAMMIEEQRGASRDKARRSQWPPPATRARQSGQNVHGGSLRAEIRDLNPKGSDEIPRMSSGPFPPEQPAVPPN